MTENAAASSCARGPASVCSGPARLVSISRSTMPMSVPRNASVWDEVSAEASVPMPR